MTNLFQYNPTPWVHARCGDNWDINLPHDVDAKGVGVVATCFAGEDIARLIAAAPALYDLLFEIEDSHGSWLNGDLGKRVRATLAKARGDQ